MYVHTHISRDKVKEVPQKNLLATIITAIKKVNTVDQLTLYTLT